MARLETTVANAIKADAVIGDIVGDSVLDFDYRTAGWNTSPVTILDQYGRFLRPTIVVDDNGTDLVSAVFSPASRIGVTNVLYIWVFGNRTDVHLGEIATITSRLRAVFNRWQDEDTQAMLTWRGRFGAVAADDGVYDRVEFAASFVPKE